jgi:hypothetical protein
MCPFAIRVMPQYSPTLAHVLPVSFHRQASSRNLGCLVCIVVTPLVAIFMALIASIPLMVILAAFDLPLERANVVFLPLLPVFAIGMIVWGYHEYQRGAGLEVTIERDGVAVEVNRRETVLRFDDVIGIRLFPAGSEFACILIPRSGRALRLPPEIVPLDLIRDEEARCQP